MPSAAPTPPPVFVGGTGRSGTTIAGELVGAGRDYALVPIELRFHVEKGGLRDLARGKVDIDTFEAAMYSTWYKRSRGARGPRGVHVVIDRPGMDAAFERLRDTYDADPWAAAGTFLHDVIAPLRTREGASSWVEMTPPNVKQMHLLIRMVPDAKFLNLVRDGRDVAASVSGRWWGPDDLESGVTWWGEQMMTIHRSVAATDPSRVLTVRLESLVGPHGHTVYEQIVSLLGIGDQREMRAFLETQMSMEQAQPGRWRRGLDQAAQQRVDALYEQQLRRLEEAGAVVPPII